MEAVGSGKQDAVFNKVMRIGVIGEGVQEWI